MRNPRVNGLYTRSWLSPAPNPKGSLVLVHGLGEHCGRYEHVAAYFVAAGYDVFAFDHYGHGNSPGEKGAMLYELHYLENLGLMVDWVRTQQRHPRLVLLGHSMGGGLAARFVSVKARPIEGLILSSPALDIGLSAAQKALLKFLMPWAGSLRIPNGLKVRGVSRDPEVIARYQADPRVHNKVAVRLVDFLYRHGQKSIAHAAEWSVPTLLLYAGADILVNPQGSRMFADAANALVQAHCFETMFHEILNEPEKNEVLARINTWLAVQVAKA